MPLTTAVIGAGPAGQLFTLIGRLLHAKTGAAEGDWVVRLYDKRDSYARTHRLRIDPAPYVDVARQLRDPRFDRVIDFLRARHFTPEVNLLESRLEEVLGEVGVHKRRLTIGAGEGETSLAQLRRNLEGEGVLAPGGLLTIVAADSVHSTVRSLVGPAHPTAATHERVARLRVDGDELPERLALVTQVQFSKNGYAEVDLFLTDDEHAAVGALGAAPSHPVRITASMLSSVRAPLFRAIVDHLERGLAGPCEVRLSSTFLLEHRIMPRRVFELRDPEAWVFLLGDAGVSLPFFRGMACLARCAYSLAQVHVDLATSPEAMSHPRVARRYEGEVAAIARRELLIVQRRATLIRLLREGARLSALLPFPVQSWLLRARDLDKHEDRSTGWLWLNVALAVLAAGIALASSALGVLFGHSLGWGWLSLPLEVAGGIAYHAALSFERGPHRFVRRVWRAQIAALFLAGVPLTLWASTRHAPFAAAPGSMASKL